MVLTLRMDIPEWKRWYGIINEETLVSGNNKSVVMLLPHGHIVDESQACRNN